MQIFILAKKAYQNFRVFMYIMDYINSIYIKWHIYKKYSGSPPS